MESTATQPAESAHENNFSELNQPLSKAEAVVAAARCLFCYDAPCTRACPTQIDVPKFIRQILHGNPAGAAETIFEENVFGGSCARACPTEVLCEGACVDRTLLKAPVEIGRLQRYATDYSQARGGRFFEAGADTGKRVAVVGAGPAGLACACELRKLGHAVTVFEARDVPGGLNTLGIAFYKISTEFALREIEPILEMIELRLNATIDGEKLKALRAEYDAVFVAVGLGPTRRLGLPGEDAPGVWDALSYIEQTHRLPPHECETGREVLVIGGGNTAIDAATAAVRLGAQRVTIAYRGAAEQLSAYQFEIELARGDGIQFEFELTPMEFMAAERALTGVRFRAATRGNTPAERVIACDLAIKAIGQSAHGELMQAARGLPGVFAGGDCANGGAELVHAVRDGKAAAAKIDSFLNFNYALHRE